MDESSMHLKISSIDGDCNKHNEGVDVEPTKEDASGEGRKASAKKTLVEMYDFKKKRRKEEAEAALKFNQKPQDGLKYASECGHLDITDPVDVVRYLLQNKNVFEKAQIGEYLGSEKEWQDNQDRRAVEYTLYDKEMWQARKGLNKVEHARNKEVDRLKSLHKEVRNVQERILAMEADKKAKGNTLKRNAVYVRGLESGRTLAMTHRTKLDLDFRVLEEQVVQGKEVLASITKESVRLNKEIGKVKREFAETVQPAYNDTRNKMMHMETTGRRQG